MDSESLQGDLKALRKLYMLLQFNESNEHSLSEILDEESRFFLKKLLDGAAESVFQGHVKIMADDMRSLLDTKSQDQAKSPNMLQNTLRLPNFEQNIRESVGKQPLDMMTRAPSVASRVRHFTSELKKRRNKRCLTCEQSIRQGEPSKNQPACSANGLTTKNDVEDKFSNVNDISTKVHDAVANIEALVSSLKLMANPLREPTDSLYRETSNSDSASSSSWTIIKANSSSSSPSNKSQRTTGSSGEIDSEFSSSCHKYESSSTYATGESRSGSDSYSSSSSSSISDSQDDNLSQTDTDYYHQSSHHSVGHRTVGMLSSLKNKLGSIFNRHHHNHPHPHHKSVEAPRKLLRNDGKKAGVKNTKNIGRKGKKLGKSKQVQADQNSNENGQHFGGLVKSLLSHVKGSDMSKLQGQHGKKLKWRKGVKCTKKARVKCLMKRNKQKRP